MCCDSDRNLISGQIMSTYICLENVHSALFKHLHLVLFSQSEGLFHYH
jgi:hypothetical protein